MQPNTSDQAHRLRQLAEPRSVSGSVANVPAKDACQSVGPRVVLINELPTLLGGLRFVWHLAQEVSQRKNHRSLVIDLTPSASRLPVYLPQAADYVQPLWTRAGLGRTTSVWNASGRSVLDIVAQVAHESPTAREMQLVYEQVVRQVSRCGDIWDCVYLLVQGQNVPLDSACWQSADEILMLLPPGRCWYEQAIAALACRLPQRSEVQRLMIIEKLPSVMAHWNRMQPSRSEPAAHEASSGARHLQVKWPQEGKLLSSIGSVSNRRLARAAKQIAAELQVSADNSVSRQAG